MSRSGLPSSTKSRVSKTRVKAGQRERQIVRILALLRILADDGTRSVRELAAMFGTRRETIYRDLRVLNDAGYPIAGDDQGRLSHPRLLPSSIPDIRLSPVELDALRSAAEQVQVALPEPETLGTAKVKLKALLDVELKYDSFTGDDVLQSWNRGTKEYRNHQAHVAPLVEAILRRCRCDVTYRKPSSATPKSYQFDPYRLLVVSGGLYVVGRVPKYEGVATLSVDRLLSVTLTSVAFEVDASFNSEKCREEAFGVSWDDPQAIVLRFCADQAPYVLERTWHSTQQFVFLPDGRLEMTFHAGGQFEIRRWILGWGNAVEVISPASLRVGVARVAESMLSFYRTS